MSVPVLSWRSFFRTRYILPIWATVKVSFCVSSKATEANGRIESLKTNPKLNANSSKEQRRLSQKFNDKDIVNCRSQKPDLQCYVKNRLQPTFAFADFALKYPEFNNPNDMPVKELFHQRLSVETAAIQWTIHRRCSANRCLPKRRQHARNSPCNRWSLG